jgi:S-adenosylmethionine hydrolase
MDNSWNVVKILDSDKFGNPLLGIAERSIENQTIKINQTVMEELANEIINIFESDCPVPTSLNDWKDDSEKIMLYLAAKKYLERHG